jgi:uncharacterized protein
MEQDSPPIPSFPVVAAAFEGSLAVLAVMVGWLAGQSPLRTLHWDAWILLLGPATIVPPLAVLAVCVRWPTRLLAEVLRVIDEVLVPLFRRCGLVEMAGISLLAGVGEEMLFRGVLQATFADWLGRLPGAGQMGWNGVQPADWAAAVAAALIFGAAHWVNAGYALLAALIGLYLGGLWILTGNLIYPIAAHALYDFVALVYLVRIRRPPAADNPEAAVPS